MKMWEHEKRVKNAALWMWYNQEKLRSDMWWVPDDLTETNSDKSSPRYSFEEANEIFDSLLKRGLLRMAPLEFYRHYSDGRADSKHIVTTFEIQRHKTKDWERLIDKGFWGIYIVPLFGKNGSWIKPIVFGALASVFGGYCVKLGEAILEKTKPAFLQPASTQPNTQKQ